MKASKSRIAVMVLACVSLAAAAAGTYFLLTAMLSEYDTTIKHFNYDHIHASVAVCICIAGAALAVAGFFAISKDLTFVPKGKKFSFAGVFASILAGLMCALYFGFCVKEGLPKEKPAIILAELTFTVLSAVYFFLKASGVFAKKPVAAISGMLPALMSAFILLNLYFNTSEPLNAPLKIFETVMLVTFMLYFTAETGILIARPKMNRKYMFAGILAVSSGGMVALSKLAARLIDPDTIGGDVVKLAFYAILLLYIVISFAEKVITLREKTEEEALLDSEYGKKEKKETEEDGQEDITNALPADDAGEAEEETEEAVSGEDIPEEENKEKEE